MTDIRIISDIIRIKYNNKTASLQELADEYDLDLFTIKQIVENLIEVSDEFDESVYDDRYDKCGQCGSDYDEQGAPTNCTGECDYMGDTDFLMEDGDPVDLSFD